MEPALCVARVDDVSSFRCFAVALLHLRAFGVRTERHFVFLERPAVFQQLKDMVFFQDEDFVYFGRRKIGGECGRSEEQKRDERSHPSASMTFTAASPLTAT